MNRVFPVALLLLTGCTMRDRYDRSWIEEPYGPPPQAAAPMLSNQDIVQLTSSGMGEEVILQSIRTTPARFDVSPMGLVSLKQSGVSDLVIQEMQRKSTVAAIPPPPVIVREEPPPVVVVTPTPHFCPAHRPRFHHHHHGHHHHGPRSGISISAEF